MIRINLLPPEIIQKRRDEQSWRWVLVGGLAVVVLLVAFYLVMFIQVSGKQADVAAIEQQAANLQFRTDQVKIFQTKQDELKMRQDIVARALNGRVDWSQMFYEISLIMPNDMWLEQLTGKEDDPLLTADNESSVEFAGKALDSLHDDPDYGFKSIAKLMIRLAELDQIQRVWLANAAKADPIPTPTASTDASATPHETATPDKLLRDTLAPITFKINSQTPQTKAAETAAGVPAPPSSP